MEIVVFLVVVAVIGLGIYVHTSNKKSEDKIIARLNTAPPVLSSHSEQGSVSAIPSDKATPSLAEFEKDAALDRLSTLNLEFVQLSEDLDAGKINYDEYLDRVAENKRRIDAAHLIAFGALPVVESKDPGITKELLAAGAEYDRLLKELSALSTAMMEERISVEDCLAQSSDLSKRLEIAGALQNELTQKQITHTDALLADMAEQRRRDEAQANEQLQARIDETEALLAEAALITPGQLGTGFVAPTERADFLSTDSFIGKCHLKRGIAIDRERKKIALMNQYAQEILPYEKLLSSEVCLDSESIISTNRIGQIGGALVAGALTGGIGALVVALGAKKKQLQNIKKVELKVLTTGTNTPIHMIQFYPGRWSTPEAAAKEATKWHDLLTIAIKESQAVMPTAPASTKPASIAEEIQKLASLKAQGLLTEEEFSKAKSALL